MIRIDWYKFGSEQIATRWIEEEPDRHAFMGQVLFRKEDFIRFQTWQQSPLVDRPLIRFEEINREVSKAETPTNQKS